ncbi:hypothetical protein LJC59_09420 [Desulfovibrio sp. OttesenSCG-928-A18]|nr:hypothetical protein [Desulfovibrio sp. OttesenSCG-928-A18]
MPAHSPPEQREQKHPQGRAAAGAADITMPGPETGATAQGPGAAAGQHAGADSGHGRTVSRSSLLVLKPSSGAKNKKHQSPPLVKPPSEPGGAGAPLAQKDKKARPAPMDPLQQEQEAYAAMLARARQVSLPLDEQEQALFAAVMHRARDARASFEELYDHAGKLAPGRVGAQEKNAENEKQDSRQRASGPYLAADFFPVPPGLNEVDVYGNPRWISLTLAERRDDTEMLTPAPVLPAGREQAGPGPATWKDAEPRKGTVQVGDTLYPAFYLSAQEGAGRDGYRDSQSAREYAGLGSIRPRKARPMRSLVRMLIVTAVLGALYTLFAKFGWVPPLF